MCVPSYKILPPLPTKLLKANKNMCLDHLLCCGGYTTVEFLMVLVAFSII